MGSVQETTKDSSGLSDAISAKNVIAENVYDITVNRINVTTPINSEETGFLDKNSDETPSKNFPLGKRKSLLREMTWNKDSQPDQDTKTKHPMEMRSRKRLKLSPYYDYKEYDDFAEDLSFLFDEQLPDLEIRPRRTKSRKRKSHVKPAIVKTNFEPCTPTSPLHAPLNPTSFPNEFSTRPNSPLFNYDLTKCNNRLTSSTEAGKFSQSEDNKMCTEREKTKNEVPRKRKRNTDTHTYKREKSNRKTESLYTRLPDYEWELERCDSKSVRKKRRNSPVAREDASQHCDVIKDKSTPTVTRMNLRRRHSSPQMSDFVVETQKTTLHRTVSSPTSFPDSEDRHDSSPSGIVPCYEISDSDHFVDSPDSGFGSESSCSAASPSDDHVNGFFDSPTKNDAKRDFESKVDCDLIKDPVSRTTSTDSGIQVSDDLLHHNESLLTKQSNEGGPRLNLCQKSVREAQRQKEEEKKREEEEALKERFRCHWVGCPSPTESRSGSDLHEHLQQFHMEKDSNDKYCCRWQGCKMFEIHCRKLSWIQWHISEHSGEKPYKCLFNGCGASFSSINSRKRHVEAHYTKVSLPKAKVGGDHGPLSRFLLNSRRVQNKKKTLANRKDCLDNGTMNFIRSALIRNEITLATDSIGNASDVVFTSKVMGRKIEKNGEAKVLLRWFPENLLPDEWVSESCVQKERRMKRVDVPWTAKSYLKNLFFFGKKPSCRKPEVMNKKSLFCGV